MAAESGRTSRPNSHGAGVIQFAPPADVAQVPLHRSVAWNAFRIYHIWCIWVGLVIIVLILVEAFLGLYVELFEGRWVVGSKAQPLNLAAACLLSVVMLSWVSSVCYAGVFLLRDAARSDAFLVYRALILGDPVHSRFGVPFPDRRETALFPVRQNRRAWIDVMVQLLCIYIPMDLLPLLAALVSQRFNEWLVWLATVSVLQVIVFWLLVCVNDYISKAQALKYLLWPSQQGSGSHPQESLSHRQVNLTQQPSFSLQPDGSFPSAFSGGFVGEDSPAASPSDLEVAFLSPLPPKDLVTEGNICVALCSWMH